MSIDQRRFLFSTGRSRFELDVVVGCIASFVRREIAHQFMDE